MYELFKVLLGLMLIFVSAFMILLILVQRGRGGGLTGALGGAGGQSAFGSKAGDVFTRITIGTAVVWIFLSMITISIYNSPPPPPAKAGDDTGLIDASTGEGDAAAEKDATTDGKLPSGDGKTLDDTLLPGESNPTDEPKSGTDPSKSVPETQPGDPGLNAPSTNDSPEKEPAKTDSKTDTPSDKAPQPPPSTPPVETPKKSDGSGGS
jgi:preprotein translocase subunit SecG